MSIELKWYNWCEWFNQAAKQLLGVKDAKRLTPDELIPLRP